MTLQAERSAPGRRPGLLRRALRRRGRVVTVLVVVGLVGAGVLLARGLRPVADVYAPVTVASASVGLTYAVDGQVCVRSTGGATLQEVRGTGTADGLTLDARVPPPEANPVIAFPVDPAQGRPVAGAPVASDGTCLRLLVRADRQGTFRARPVQVVVGYGPGAVLKRTLSVTPPLVLEVVRTGPDPRQSAG